MKHRILVISFSPLDRDPRVRRQIFSLTHQGYQVAAAGFTDPEIKHVDWWPVIMPSGFGGKVFSAICLKLRLFRLYYRLLPQVRSFLSQWNNHGSDYDLLIANDIEALPIAIEIADGTPVFFDAHEYSPQEMDSWMFRFFFASLRDWQCRTYLPHVSAMSTVCQGIAELYQKKYGANAFLMHNAPAYRELEPSHVKNKSIRLVHHGGAQRSRGLETMIEMMNSLDDRFQLHFYLVAHVSSQVEYLKELKSAASDLKGRVVFHDPVHSDQIAEEINQYDVGVYPLKPSSVNDSLALPNKFFEFVQARLAIVIGPSQEMVRLVNKYDLGLIAEDFTADAMARTLSNLTKEKVWQCKQQSDAAAKELCFDAQEPKFLESVQQLVNH